MRAARQVGQSRWYALLQVKPKLGHPSTRRFVCSLKNGPSTGLQFDEPISQDDLSLDLIRRWNAVLIQYRAQPFG